MARPRGARAWWVVVLVVCGAVIRAAAQVEAAGPPGLGARPNIVLICSDDLGSAVLDEAIDLGVPTPSLDRLASEGVLFSRAYACAPVCGPSRAGLLTGVYPQRFGFEFNPDPRTHAARPGREFGLVPEARTLGEMLGDAGYRAAIVGKWHLGEAAGMHPLEQGFDEFFGFLNGTCAYYPEGRRVHRNRRRVEEREYLTDALAREAVAFVERQADVEDRRPFFLYVAFSAIHDPATARRGDERFASIEDERARTYARMLAAMDDGVGAILDAIDRSGLASETIVVFASDNGGHTIRGLDTNGDLRLGKQFLFEGGVRVPLVVRWAGVATPGVVCDVPVSLLDVAPTLVAAAGVEEDGLLPAFDGLDARALLESVPGDGVAGFASRPLFWRAGTASAVREGDWKLVVSGGSAWLFDVGGDPGETLNLAEDEVERTARLRALLASWEDGLEEAYWGAGVVEEFEVLGLTYLRAR